MLNETQQMAISSRGNHSLQLPCLIHPRWLQISTPLSVIDLCHHSLPCLAIINHQLAIIYQDWQSWLTITNHGYCPNKDPELTFLAAMMSVDKWWCRQLFGDRLETNQSYSNFGAVHNRRTPNPQMITTDMDPLVDLLTPGFTIVKKYCWPREKQSTITSRVSTIVNHLVTITANQSEALQSIQQPTSPEANISSLWVRPAPLSASSSMQPSWAPRGEMEMTDVNGSKCGFQHGKHWLRMVCSDDYGW